MKNLNKTHFVAFLALCLSWTCAPENDHLSQAESPQIALFKTAANPSYSQEELENFISDNETEEAFVNKTEILTYALSRFIGDQTGITTGNNLRVVIPCDLGLSDPAELFRVMSQSSGMTENQVLVTLSSHVVSCLETCTLPAVERDKLFETVANSLILEGDRYDMVTTYSKTIPQGSSDKIFLSYGIGNSDGELRAFGFLYNLVLNSVTKAYMPLDEAQELDMLLFDSRIPNYSGNVQRYNDPCYYDLSGGNNGGGNGQPGGDLDDDGAYKNVVSGPMVMPDPQFDNCNPVPGVPPIKDGLRVVQFHLADRNEGGLFGGKSEVYMSVSIYLSTGPDLTLRTNTEGKHTWIPFNSSNDQCWLSKGPGKLLSKVPKSDIGVGNATIISEPSPDEWTIIESGFCEGSGYNRIFLVFYEHDKISGDGDNLPQLVHTDWTAPEICDIQYIRISRPGDTWFENSTFSLSPTDFLNNNGTLWLTEIPGGFSVENSQPTNDFSWFEVEMF